MRILVSYDIVNTKRRQKTATLLQKVITRVQDSVFIGHMDEEVLAETVAGIRKIVKHEEDKVFVMKVCENCFDKIVEIGQSNIKNDEVCISVF